MKKVMKTIAIWFERQDAIGRNPVSARLATPLTPKKLATQRHILSNILKTRRNR
jgi:hypothetical protein